jgi:Ribosomal protein L7/L12 C-terminal domain
MSQLPDEAVVRISDALYAGRKIEAIRLYRQATKLGLKESKDFIEALEVRLRQESPEKFTAPPGQAGCVRAAAILFVIASVLVAHYLLR